MGYRGAMEIWIYMRNNSLFVSAIQETRTLKSDSYVTDDCIWEQQDHEGAGVGFMISSKMRSHMLGFIAISNCVRSLKLLEVGGCCRICSAYAPHSLRPPGERRQFMTTSSFTSGSAQLLGESIS